MSAFSLTPLISQQAISRKTQSHKSGSCRIVLFRQILHIRAAGILVHSLRCSTVNNELHDLLDSPENHTPLVRKHADELIALLLLFTRQVGQSRTDLI